MVKHIRLSCFNSNASVKTQMVSVRLLMVYSTLCNYLAEIFITKAILYLRMAARISLKRSKVFCLVLNFSTKTFPNWQFRTISSLNLIDLDNCKVVIAI